jgi:hypothetical protein
VIGEARSEAAFVAENPGEALLAMLHSKEDNESTTNNNITNDIDDLDVLTEAQITAKSQQRSHLVQKQSKLLQQYEDDMRFIDNWVQNLPMPVPFKIQNVDAILAQLHLLDHSDQCIKHRI